MPEEGIKYLPKENLMSYEEMLRMAALFANQGINKIRITGGEPFLRKDLIYFLEELSSIKGIDKISITSNGTLLSKHLNKLKELGITSINLSIDSLDRQRFFEITRRDELPTVLSCMHEMLAMGFQVKLNAVVMKDKNLEDILPLIALTEKNPFDVRFIEEMPFNGDDNHSNDGFWSYSDLLFYIDKYIPNLVSIPMKPGSTAMEYRIPGHKGKMGIIASYSRTFCGSCNRIRVTPTGVMKTCLYDQGIFNIKSMMRAQASDSEILIALQEAIGHRAKDGFEAERNRGPLPIIGESMASIGG
jgi:cyclic pyranopterin phosphate synthase